MVKFEEETYLDNVRGALALRGQIEAIVDAAAGQCGNLCWLGIGGTWASCLQTTVHMKERSAMEVFALNAAEYNTTGDRRVGERTFVVISSVTGTTEEMCAAVEKLHAAGARVLGFIDKEDSPLARAVDWCISFPHNEQLKFFMTADRFMFLRGEFKDYDRYYAQLDACLPEGLAAAEKAADEFGRSFAKAHMNDKLHYFVGAGTLYGATYSYAMCYWEEMHWIRTKSIHAAEFFHGMLEIVDRDTPVTVFVGEDSQRELAPAGGPLPAQGLRQFLRDRHGGLPPGGHRPGVPRQPQPPADARGDQPYRRPFGGAVRPRYEAAALLPPDGILMLTARGGGLSSAPRPLRRRHEIRTVYLWISARRAGRCVCRRRPFRI